MDTAITEEEEETEKDSGMWCYSVFFSQMKQFVA